jgi:thiamin-phosphate kinase
VSSSIYELGETAVVRAIIRNLDIEFEDCAVIDITDAEYLVATTDMFHRTTDFPEEMSAWQIGWMSAAGTLSDIAAMGAHPCGLLVSIGLPDIPPVFVESMIEGLSACARECGTAIIGGDTDSHQELTITGTALGRVRKDQILRRRGAQVGDLVCVTGAKRSDPPEAWRAGRRSGLRHRVSRHSRRRHEGTGIRGRARG